MKLKLAVIMISEDRNANHQEQTQLGSVTAIKVKIVGLAERMSPNRMCGKERGDAVQFADTVVDDREA